jgi:hypothetical protein
MSSLEFFAMVKEHLKPGGVMAVNLNMHSEAAGSINDWLLDTIASQFTYVYYLKLPTSTSMVLFASENPLILENLRAEAAKLPAANPLRRLLNHLQANLTRHNPGPLILTDDKAPVELLGMRVIDELIARNLKYYQDLLGSEGLGGLLDGLGVTP